MYSTVLSGALLGVRAAMVLVEVDATNGLPSINMVGSLSGEVRESKERVLAALKNAGIDIPPKHVTINLSPADLRKEGTAYDLPIAIGMLEALGFFPKESVSEILFLGELGLNGEIRTVRGVLPIVREAAGRGVRECIVPQANAREGAMIPGICVRGAADLEQVMCYLLAKGAEREKILPAVRVSARELLQEKDSFTGNDFAEVRGQEVAKRAAKIAAAGFHNLLMIGPPGAGKSMIAKRIPGIMPPLSLEESLEVTTIYSVAGLLGNRALITNRPFQSPHHTISLPALTGGGTLPRPGIISLSHRGVLFLDELPEFQRNSLDGMRQPLEDKQIQITRVGGNLTYPADFMLVCAMNPCPCGYFPNRNKCRCTEPQIKHYAGRVSGPILDRIDLCVELHPVEVTNLHGAYVGESSAEIQRQVEQVRQIQAKRFEGTAYRFNGDVQAADMERFCHLGKEEKGCMERLYEEMGLSARSYHRICKVARTIADLAGEEKIRVEHLLEAAMFRPAQEIWRI
ncbi:MAG: YifB family Mg chelatase-like AAA ATPase [Lachnospiraceae bacterium]|nr:YifB family Mg chelatase-like AAA ATPase [Lachnospiraceae bacterium]